MKNQNFVAIIQSLSLSFVSFMILLIILEIGVFRLNAHHLPLKLKAPLNEATQILAQSSKRGVIPKDYIAIVGDSHAQGSGDWLWTASIWSNPPYGSHHIIHERTKQDVISYGRAGNGNIIGIAIDPISYFKFLRSTFLYGIEQPETILVYYYEGNDQTDDLLALKHNYKGQYDESKFFDKHYFKNFLDDLVEKQNLYSWYDTLMITQYLKHFVNSFKKINRRSPFYLHYSYHDYPTSITQIWMNGSRVRIPDDLQSPALGISLDELHKTFYVFEQSLHYLQDFFSGSKLYVVYIPSILTSYDIASQTVRSEDIQRGFRERDSKKMMELSEFIFKNIKRITEESNVAMIDARPSIREVSKQKFVHGPADWDHFNKTGYMALADAIVPYLLDAKRLPKQVSTANLLK